MVSLIANHIPIDSFEYTFLNLMQVSDSLLTLAGLSLLAALYLPVVIFATLRRRGQESTATLVGLYGLTGLSLGVFEAFWRTGHLPGFGAQAFGDIETYGVLTLAFLTIMIVRLFMRHPIRIWFGTGILIGLGLLYFLLERTTLPYVILSSGSWTLTNDRLGVAWAVFGWLVFMIGTALTIMRAYRRTQQPLLRNRLIYWYPTILLITLNDSLILAGRDIPGNPLRWLASILIAYVALTHDLPYLRQILRRTLVYVIATLLIMVFYLIGITLAGITYREVPGINLSLIGAGMALVLALLFTPTLGLVRRLIDRWLRLDQTNASRTLHEYSESISNILNIERLETVAVGVIMENMQVRRGFLFLVDHVLGEAGNKVYRLRTLRNVAEQEISDITLAEGGSIASYFAREGRPLLQYDLDLLPAFRSAPKPEREWFKQLEAEVYLPISSNQQWIGLLAFGPKLNGNRFSQEDLITLSVLANQTAVALENARLVDNLMQLNAELTQARLELESSNRALEHLDQTKSEFISIASHELRTPLTVIKGYSEMLMESPRLDATLRQTIKGIHDGALRLHEILESMFDIAQIDARSLQLHLEPVDLGAMLHEVCNSQSKAARDRNITLRMDLPSLPKVQADPDSLRKVFQHLVGNAVKFTPNEGRVTITGGMTDESPNGPSESGVEIIVSDTGVGVDPDFREIIFTKFYQPGDLRKHSTSKNSFKGSGAGLGLALAKGIVEAHGGRIWVESPGYDETRFPGSQFHVVVPVTKSVKEAPLQASPPIKVDF